MNKLVFKIYFVLTLIYFSQKMCIGRFILSARGNGLKTYFLHIFGQNFKIYDFLTLYIDRLTFLVLCKLMFKL